MKDKRPDFQTQETPARPRSAGASKIGPPNASRRDERIEPDRSVRVPEMKLSAEPLLDLVYEDGDFLVVNKPSDLVCHPTKQGPFSSLIGRLRLYLGPESEPHLINRLDRETSGLVVVAKCQQQAAKLRRIWEARSVRKEYIAIVHGRVAADEGLIEAPLGNDENSRVVIKDCVRPDGAKARTEFRVEKRFVRDTNRFTLMRLLPYTGRKHQLRIHLSHYGHPIVGDKIYGGDEDLYLALVEDRLTDAMRATLILPNHALHAAGLEFLWGDTTLTFSAKPASWFSAFCSG